MLDSVTLSLRFAHVPAPDDCNVQRPWELMRASVEQLFDAVTLLQWTVIARGSQKPLFDFGLCIWVRDAKERIT